MASYIRSQILITWILALIAKERDCVGSSWGASGLRGRAGISSMSVILYIGI